MPGFVFLGWFSLSLIGLTRGPNFLQVVWIQYEMEELQKEKGKAYFMLIFPDIIPLNFCTLH
jgi:hypothetical protein